MKKTIALLATVALLAGLIAGCGGNGAPESTADTPTVGGESSATASGAAVSAPGQLPIVNEPIQLSIFATQHIEVEDYDTNKLTKYLEEQTGIDIVWQLVPQQDAIQKVNLLLASNTDLPDVFMCQFGLTNDLISDMADQGVFIPLDDMIAEHGYWYKEVLEKEPLLNEITKLPNGKQYTMPHIVKSVPNETAGRAWINNVWLENLGLSTPTTTDELTEVLRAFKTGDPNGNGKADEIPYIGASVTGWHQNPDEFIMNSFVQYNRDMPVYIDDSGKIQASFAQDAYRKGLIYMNMLCAEGLLDPATFTQDESQMNMVFGNEDIALVGMAPGGTISWVSMQSDRAHEYGPLSPLKGPDGVQLSWYNPYGSYSVKDWVITSACENPEAAFKLADYMYSREVSMWNRLGEPGVDYLVPENGEIGVDGNPASFIPVLEFDSTQNSHWVEVGPNYNDFDNNGIKGDDPYELQQFLWNATKDFYTPYVPKVENCYNQLTFYPVEDARKLSDVWSTLRDFQRQTLAEYVTGVRDPNNDDDWNAYIAELENIGYLDWLAIMQKGLDAA